MKLRMKEKGMQNGTPPLILQKGDRKMIIFHLFGSVPGEKNAFLLHFSQTSFLGGSQ